MAFEGRIGAIVAADGSPPSKLPPPHARLEHVPLERSVGLLHQRLTLAGRFDTLVDVAGGDAIGDRLACLAHHVRPHGWVVVRLPRPGTAARSSIDEMLTEVLGLRHRGRAVPPHDKDRRARSVRERHALATSTIEVEGNRLTLRPTVEALPTLAEAELSAEALATRPDWGTTIHEVDADTRQAVGAVLSTEPSEPDVSRLESPPLLLRRYVNPVCHARMAVHNSEAWLPDTFRHPIRPRLNSPAITLWDERAALVPTTDRSPERLRGAWYYADNPMRGHFGHALTEQLSKLWAWERAAAEEPELGLLVTADGDRPMASWEYELLEAAGISRERVRVVDVPVQPDTLYAATPAYVIQRYLHPEMLTVYDRVASHLQGRARRGRRPRRIFLTRPQAKRGCLNGEEVESAFIDHQFTVIAPEELPLPEQVALVGGADVVAGYAGSAMFHVALRTSPARVLALTHTNYHAANEKFICAGRGHQLHLIRSQPEVESHGRFSVKAFHSPYRVDWQREGATLLRVLGGL